MYLSPESFTHPSGILLEDRIKFVHDKLAQNTLHRGLDWFGFDNNWLVLGSKSKRLHEFYHLFLQRLEDELGVNLLHLT